MNLQFGMNFRFIGNNVPHIIDKKRSDAIMLTFEDISRLAEGGKKLGVLKADVDDLGMIFAIGLKQREKQDQRSVSRIHTLSTFIDRYFAGYLNTLCEEDPYYANICDSCQENLKPIELEDNKLIFKDVNNEICDSCKKIENEVSPFYINYSGGDDLVVIGPWDRLFLLAERIMEEFKSYTGHNPSLTLSAGISIVPPKFPISEAIKQADENLELAKSHIKSTRDPLRPLKNSIAAFGECVIWDGDDYVEFTTGFRQLLSFAQDLEHLVKSQQISKSFIYSLLAMWKKTFQDIPDIGTLEEVRNQRKRYMPLLYYQLARHFPKDEQKRIEMENNIKPKMPWIRLPVSWVSLRTR